MFFNGIRKRVASWLMCRMSGREVLEALHRANRQLEVVEMFLEKLSNDGLKILLSDNPAFVSRILESLNANLSNDEIKMLLSDNPALVSLVRDMTREIRHDLVSPLSNVVGALDFALQALMRNDPDVEGTLAFLTPALVDAQHVKNLVERITDYQVQSRDTDLAKLVKDVVETTSRFEKRGILTNIPSTSLTVVIDPIVFEQILRNLLGNALKFTPREGVIEVRLQEEASFIQLEIENSDAPIPFEMLEAIWEKDFRVKDSDAPGTGLGLALVRQKVKLLGGKCWAVRFRENNIFFVRFPLPGPQ